MNTSVLPYTEPLKIVASSLIQAVGTTESYRSATDQLLAQAWQLDSHFGEMIAPVTSVVGTDYFLNPMFADLQVARRLFIEIREHKDRIEKDFPLLGHAATLVDYISHITTNLIPMMSRENRLLATVAEAGNVLEYSGISEKSFEWSIALFLGLSPSCVFRTNIHYEDEKIIRTLSPFGMGVIPYLLVALQPAVGASGAFPSEITYNGVSKKISPAPLVLLPDGAITLEEF